jgi:ADP-ribose pyrophosphatase YjhB (NUDIX family)
VSSLPSDIAVIAEEVAAIAGVGLTFAESAYDRQRYERLRELAAGLLASGGSASTSAIKSWIDLDTGYVTPKLDVRAIVLRENTILLARERADGFWALPGGFCDVGLSPARNVEKETEEESGITVAAIRLLALYDKRLSNPGALVPHIYKAFYLCQETGGQLLAETAETTGADFFPLSALPPLSEPRNTQAQIQACVRIARDPGASAAFE